MKKKSISYINQTAPTDYKHIPILKKSMCVRGGVAYVF